MPSLFKFFMCLFLFLVCSTLLTETLAAEEHAPTSSMAYENYLKLRQLVPQYQEAALHPWPQIAAGKTLIPGMTSPRISQLRNRLKQTSDLLPAEDIGGDYFDDQLDAAVKTFQSRHGLKADGIVGKDTRTQLNISAADRAKQLEINMQRWANLAEKTADRFILVNIPDYQLEIIENNQKILDMKVIVGKPEWPTPEIVSNVTFIVLNPYWNVPSRIAKKEIVPKMIENPNYLSENNIKIFSTPENNAVELSAESIDWQAVQDNGFNYHFRQDSGESNSLGIVKFEFKNPYDVYMHDTPAKSLFDDQFRALSHGCIRLEKPFELVEYFSKQNTKLTDERVHFILESGKNTHIKIAQPIPIYITYFTAWVDEKGVLQFREDIYGKAYYAGVHLM